MILFFLAIGILTLCWDVTPTVSSHAEQHIMWVRMFIFDSSSSQKENGQPVKTVCVGNVSTPLMCLSQSVHPLDSRAVWAGCGTTIRSFAVDYDVSKTIDTRQSLAFQWVTVTFKSTFYCSRSEKSLVEIWRWTEKRVASNINVDFHN